MSATQFGLFAHKAAEDGPCSIQSANGQAGASALRCADTSIGAECIYLVFRPDVERRIVHKTGRPSIELGAAGVPTGRAFFIVQLRDGRFAWEFTDSGERRMAPRSTTTDELTRMLASGSWREEFPG